MCDGALVMRSYTKRSDLNPSKLSRFCVPAEKTGFCLVFWTVNGSRIIVSGHRTMTKLSNNLTQYPSFGR
jgi:hypothetical protein